MKGSRASAGPVYQLEKYAFKKPIGRMSTWPSGGAVGHGSWVLETVTKRVFPVKKNWAGYIAMEQLSAPSHEPQTVDTTIYQRRSVLLHVFLEYLVGKILPILSLHSSTAPLTGVSAVVRR